MTAVPSNPDIFLARAAFAELDFRPCLRTVLDGDARSCPFAGQSGQPLQRLRRVGAQHAKQSGDTDVRLFAVAAWRGSTHVTEAERITLALTDCVTYLNERTDLVPDDVWCRVQLAKPLPHGDP